MQKYEKSAGIQLIRLIYSMKRSRKRENRVVDGEKSRGEATRTPDSYVPNVVRYQLRYTPKNGYRKEKACNESYRRFICFCRGTRIRTWDPLLPKQVR